MAADTPSPTTLYAGRYSSGDQSWSVTLRPCGEGFELVALDCLEAAHRAVARDQRTLAALFRAPRAGSDRYPDWPAWEWDVRLGRERDSRKRVWRVAETTDWAAYLGQAVWSEPGDVVFPVAAALWKGWSRTSSVRPRALFWRSDVRGHVWLTRPFALPGYETVERDISPADLLVALAQLEDPRNLALDVGGAAAEFVRELERVYPGSVRPAEPFADIMVSEELRAELAEHALPAGFLPAVGAARALGEGAPSTLNLCASWPEAGAGAG